MKVAWDSRSIAKRFNTKDFYTENGGSEVVVHGHISYIYVAKFGVPYTAAKPQ